MPAPIVVPPFAFALAEGVGGAPKENAGVVPDEGALDG